MVVLLLGSVFTGFAPWNFHASIAIQLIVFIACEYAFNELVLPANGNLI